MMLFDEDNPKAGGWFTPMMIGALLYFFGMLLQPSDWQYAQDVSVLMILLAFLCAPLVLTEFWRYYTTHRERLHSEHQNALSTTPVVLLAQYMKSMHPEAVRVLERFGVRTSWQVRVDFRRNIRTWILEGTDPGVHFGFIEFVLMHSGKALYPRNRFKEGSKRWDPDGLVEDREQHAEFERWLHSRLMVTRSHGEYKPAEFIPPWTPQLIMETMGLTGEQELHQPDEEVNGDQKAEPSGRRNGNGNGAATPIHQDALKELEQTREMKARTADLYKSGS